MNTTKDNKQKKSKARQIFEGVFQSLTEEYDKAKEELESKKSELKFAESK